LPPVLPRMATAALIALLASGVGTADASRAPTRAEKKAIKRAFLKAHPKTGAKVLKIRVSTANPRFAGVTYRIDIREVKAAKVYKAPSPVVLKKGKGGKWKPTTKVPAKVTKDLKDKAKSDIKISGEVTAHLTQGASCTQTPGFYVASLYDRARDIYLRMEFNRYTGPGFYPARGVLSVATLAVGTKGTTPQWETGQGNNADAPSGELYVDPGPWGIIEAGMAKYPDANFYPITVNVSGYWDCR
jgi:hypothetical protein